MFNYFFDTVLISIIVLYSWFYLTQEIQSYLQITIEAVVVVSLIVIVIIIVRLIKAAHVVLTKQLDAHYDRFEI